MPTRLAVAITALLLIVLNPTTALELRAQQIAGAPGGTDLFAGREWGEASGGAQLRLAPAWAAEERAARDGLLLLALQVQHTLNTPVAVDFQRLTYQFEYEIDGSWHAFEAVAPSATDGIGTLPVRAGAPMQLLLMLPLNSRVRALQLRAITPAGLGGALELKPGSHSIRVRPQPGAFGATVRTAAISNAVTVTVPVFSATTPMPSTPPLGTRSNGLRFVTGPPDGRALVEQLLRQPPALMLLGAPRLARADSIEILGPIERHSLLLPRRIDAADPAFPSRATDFDYVVNADGRGAAVITVRVGTDGRATLINTAPGATAEPLARALDQVAALEPVSRGAYEPRVLDVTAWAGMPPRLVLWLHSTTGGPDLFYQPRNPDPRVSALMEFETLYTAPDFFKAVRQLPVVPRHDEAWAIATAAGCAKGARGTGGGPLLFDKGVAEISVTEGQDGIVWRVHFPEETTRLMSHPGANVAVDESTGACSPLYLN